MSLNKLGRYDIIRVLGKGAMGLVYEARDPNLDRRVAIKTIKVENLSEEAAAEYEARFRTEARSAARLQHPNIVSVYDSDRHGDMAYLVMEYIQGEDLKQHLDGGKRYSLAQSLGMVADLLSALDYAHRQSIVHRDVKPANLLIEASGRVKLTDFGVARIQDSGEATRTQGSMVGTLKYMSPEQVQGLPVDARADLFAVGVVLYQLLTGKRPFDGETDFAIIQQIVGHTPEAPSAFSSLLPPAIDAVVARALTKKRDQRFATAQEFAQALQAASGQALDPTVVPPLSTPGRAGGNATDTGLQRSRVGGSTVRLSSGTDTGSTVTQELELVYWKDIKDTDDLEDLQGFLVQFPSGIYADLARRRLRKLGGTVPGESSGTGTGSSTSTLVASPDEISEWTRLQVGQAKSATAQTVPLAAAPPAAAVPPAEATATPLVAATPAPMADAPAAPVATGKPNEPGPAEATGPAPAKSPAANPPARKKALLALAGVAVLAVAGLAFQFRPAPTVTPAAASSDTAASAAAAPAAAPPPAAGAPPAVTPAARAAPGAADSAGVAAAAAAASRPVAKRPVAPVPEKPPVAKASPARTPVQEAGPGAAQAPEPVAATAAAAAAAGNPRAACENRVLLGFQSCMNEQCARPSFARHPVCVERRNQERLRLEAQELRN